jgi:hypothetical protein
MVTAASWSDAKDRESILQVFEDLDERPFLLDFRTGHLRRVAAAGGGWPGAKPGLPFRSGARVPGIIEA